MDILIRLKGNNIFGVLLLMLFIYPVSLFSQIATVRVDRSNRYNIIFGANYPLPFEVNLKERFNPSDEDVKKGEVILREFSDLKLRKYIRQYLGYIDSNNNKILVVNMLKDLGAKKNKLYYKDWESEFILGFGRIYERNTLTQRINLATKELMGTF